MKLLGLGFAAGCEAVAMPHIRRRSRNVNNLARTKVVGLLRREREPAMFDPSHPC